ncbi:MAG TPA: serine/threonine-protein kinase [Polyangiaceae bacterium]|jgi:serine/threonine-protein kinase
MSAEARDGDEGEPQRIGSRYVLHHRDRLGSGGMATVYLGHDEHAPCAPRTVAIKRMHPWLLKEPELMATLLDEGRVVSHIAHPNVVALREVVVEEQELFLVLEYVHGEPLSALVKAVHARGERVPSAIACALVRDLLRGLHAAHEANDEMGKPLGIVHRDVSPQNLLVGVDGRGHLLDFGVAKAAGRLQSTRNGSVKGKLAYMAPEQLRAGLVTRRSDLYSASVVFWELLAGKRIFGEDPEAHVVVRKIGGPFLRPSTLNRGASDAALDPIVMKGLSREPPDRYGSAAEMADELERTASCASAEMVSAWVHEVGAESLAARAAQLLRIEGPASAGSAEESAPWRDALKGVLAGPRGWLRD